MSNQQTDSPSRHAAGGYPCTHGPRIPEAPYDPWRCSESGVEIEPVVECEGCDYDPDAGADE